MHALVHSQLRIPLNDSEGAYLGWQIYFYTTV